MPKSSQSGFSLLEVLISLAVLAACMTALTALQGSNWQVARQAAARSLAVQIVTEIADSLRMGAAPSLAAFSVSASEPGVFCDQFVCTALQMQAFEIYGWQRRIKAGLPGARLVVCRDERPWDAVARAWRWPCEAGQLPAAPVVIKLGWPEQGGSADFAPLVTATVGPLP